MSRHYAWFTERKQTGIIYTNVRAALLENTSLCEMGLDNYIAKILMRDKDPIVQDTITGYNKSVRR